MLSRAAWDKPSVIFLDLAKINLSQNLYQAPRGSIATLPLHPNDFKPANIVKKESDIGRA